MDFLKESPGQNVPPASNRAAAGIRSSTHSKTVRLMFIFSVIVFLFFSCAKDPNPIIPRFEKYLVLCPTGQQTCYANCGIQYDTNGNGRIDPVEQIYYNGCTADCDSRCSLSFLLLIL